MVLKKLSTPSMIVSKFVQPRHPTMIGKKMRSPLLSVLLLHVFFV